MIMMKNLQVLSSNTPSVRFDSLKKKYSITSEGQYPLTKETKVLVVAGRCWLKRG
jgi:hypothetical protein